MKPISLKINGERIATHVAPGKTLLDFLRDDLELKGTKKGCDTGDCGACTVLMDGFPVSSCLVLALEAEGKEITTIEGLTRKGDLNPLQQAFVEQGAIQCGFCTPGMIITAKAFLDRHPQAGKAEIKQALSGNLCRCGAYQRIVGACLSVNQKSSNDDTKG